MARALERAFQLERAEILDLGPLCGDTVVYLADRGARVSVAELEPPPQQQPEAAPGEAIAAEPAPDPIVIDQPDGRFDLVLAWERFDFTPPERLADLAAEVRRVMADGAWLLLFAVASRAGRDTRSREAPARFRLLADDRLERVPEAKPPRLRWVHPNRDLERALAPLSIQGIHLQRNQTREVLAVKRAPGAGPRRV